MKHWRSLVVGLTIVVVLAAIAKPTFDARLSWYERGDHLDGANLLVTCLSGTPIFMDGSLFPWDGKNEEPFLSDLEVSFACRTLENNAQTIASDIDPNFGGNRTFNRLVNDVNKCNHSGFSSAEKQLCSESYFDAIDWMIAHGAPINPENSCGYLHSAALDMKEDLFHFLLSRGADPEHLCPPTSLAFGPGTERLVQTKPETITGMLRSLLSEYSDEEKDTIVIGWVRMLEALEPTSK